MAFFTPENANSRGAVMGGAMEALSVKSLAPV